MVKLKMKLLGWVLIQSDTLIRKKKLRHRQGQREGHVKTHGEDGHL